MRLLQVGLSLLLASMACGGPRVNSRTAVSGHPSEVRFAVFGDMPYCDSGVCRPADTEYQSVVRILDHMKAKNVPFAVHVGDVFKEDADHCGPPEFEVTRELFKRAAFPLIVVPGDNETTECS